MDRALSIPFWNTVPGAKEATGPDRKPRRAPVFIHDSVTPWGGETMLLSILRRQALDRNKDQDSTKE
jgi:hypothetical protein